jgi:hypothetical protein
MPAKVTAREFIFGTNHEKGRINTMWKIIELITAVLYFLASRKGRKRIDEEAIKAAESVLADEIDKEVQKRESEATNGKY